MEWLILLLLIPAILVPIVLLFGFAGCYNPAPAYPVVVTLLEVDPVQTPPVDQTVAPANYCFVQRIPISSLFLPDEFTSIVVRITLVGSPAGNATINNLYISAAATSGNLWDSDADLTMVLPSALTLPNDQPKNLDVIYSPSQTQDLIIAFDFTATAGQANLRFVPQPGVTLYFKQGVQQASVRTRDSDYITQPDPRLYLVEKIVAEGVID